MAEEITPRQINVREVTNYQISWTEVDPGGPGTFTIQLILDEGAAEYVLTLPADDADPLQEIMRHAKNVHFDLDRKVLMFGNESIGSV